MNMKKVKFSERVPISLSPRHRLALEKLSGAFGEPMSVVVRRMIFTEAKRLDLWPTQREIKLKEEAKRHV